MLVDDESWTEDDVIPPEPASSSSDAVVFEDVEAFLGEHGIQLEEVPPGDIYSEQEDCGDPSCFLEREES